MGYFRGRGNASMMMMMMIVSFCMSKGVLATNYKVGDGSWTIMSYDSWLSGKTFKVGDTLEFVYSSVHNVVEVSKANYGSCAQGSNTANTDGDTTYPLSTVGTKYYICSVPTHCESGMKIAVTVEGATTTTPSPPPPTTTTPSTNSSTTPSTNSSTTPSTNSSPLSRSSLLFTSLLTLGLSILFFKS